MHEILTIARKEMVDGMRDLRSVLASMFYALMGPVAVGLVSFAVLDKSGNGTTILTGMMATFTLVSAFVGGMNVAMDTVAGERERKSLLPLLWFAVVFALSGIHIPPALNSLLRVALGLASLPLLAAAAQLLISTASHAAKEAQTYLSLLVFVPMGIGMFLVFSPQARHAGLSYLPLVGQQLQLETWMNGREIGVIQPIILTFLTLSFAILLLLVSTNRLRRDEILYGN